jgi:3-methyladenine DNA glycosylase AlkD
MSVKLCTQIQKELARKADARVRASAGRWFKEPVSVRGIRTPVVRAMSRAHFPTNASRQDVILCCSTLLASGYVEDSLIAFDWLFRIREKLILEDLALFELWVDEYVTNWALCDDLCCHALGWFLVAHPSAILKTTDWAKDENRWRRRTSAVSLIYGLRNGLFLDHAFAIAKQIMYDTNDLVQKGCGWMLKVASTTSPNEVYSFILTHGSTMPRTVLRYALEKYPPHMRHEAMAMHKTKNRR